MKKYKFIILLIFLLFISLLNVNAVHNNILKGKTIALDIGHGGKDPGTLYKDIYEKDLNLQIGKKIKKELLKLNAKVIMTREGDYDLSSPGVNRRKKSDFDNRIKLINSSNANYYFSIHLNYLSDTRYYGPQVFYNDVDKDNKKIAQTIQDVLNKNIKTTRTIKKMKNANYYMYNKLNKKGVLIELGFLSNANERIKLQQEDYQQKLAKAVVLAITKLD